MRADFKNSGEIMRIDPQKLRARRLAKRFTQQELSSLAGVSQATVAKLERGQAAGRARDLQDALARVLDVRPEDLCLPEGQAQPTITAADLAAEPERAPSGVEAAIETALLRAFDNTRHTFGDVETVRVILREASPGSEELAELSVKMLDAAARVRSRGSRPTTARIAVEVLAPGRSKPPGASSKGNPLQHGSGRGGRV